MSESAIGSAMNESAMRRAINEAVKGSMDKLASQLSQNRQLFSTPCYVYSIEGVVNNYQALKARLGTPLIYSLKANSCLDLIARCGHVFEDGIEIASIGELNLLPKSDSPRYINNPSADKSFIRAAVASQCTLIVDNLAQLEAVIALQGKRSIRPLVMRLNPSVLHRFSNDSMDHQTDHFGLDWDDAMQALATCKAHNLEVAGFHLFRGSYRFTKWATATARAALNIIQAFEDNLGYAISLVNLGGGFDSNWQDQAFDFDQYRNLLSEYPSHIHVVHESGRAIMSSAGYFVTEVRYVKSIEKQKYGVCNGGMTQNFLLAKTENAFKRFAQPVILRQGQRVTPESESNGCYLVGTSCNKEDVIGEVPGVDIQPGDLAIFSDCGAYNARYTVAPFLSLPPAKSYLME